MVTIRGFHWAFHSRTKKTLAIFVAVANRHHVKSRADMLAAPARACGVRIERLMVRTLRSADVGSAAGGIEEDVQGLDSAAFDPRNIDSGHRHGTVRWAGLPAQPSQAVMADRGADRREGEVRRQARQQRLHRLIDRGMAARRGIRWFI